MRDMTNALGPLADEMLPRLTPLRENLTAASFSVMKLLPAWHILTTARQRGELTEESEVIESTSGTFGLALAMLRPYFGFSLTLVSDPVIDPMLMMRLRALGAKVEIVTESINGGYQLARLKRVDECMKRAKRPFFPNQYNNPMNTEGYHVCAEYLAERLGRVDLLVGTVGTGGSMCGTGEGLRRRFPHVRIVGVDTHRSVIFGQPPGERRLRGLGNSLVPANVAHALFDEVHWVSAEEAFAAARVLHRRYGLFMGGTSGAAWMVADWVARMMPDKRVVTLFPDDGVRYLDLIYGEDDAAKDAARIPAAPQALAHPVQAAAQWCFYPWARRALGDVMAKDAA